MHLFNFAKNCDEGLYSFLDIERPAVTVQDPLAGFEKELYAYRLSQSLSLAEYLLKGLGKYIFIKASPYTREMFTASTPCLSKWHYHLTANDFDGAGIDKAFHRASEIETDQSLLSRVDTLLSLKDFPEDSFGDKLSQLSVFGLFENRWNDLREIVQQEQPPALQDFLRHGELFIHIIVSKTEGFFHAMLIKTRENIENSIQEFQNVIASDN